MTRGGGELGKADMHLHTLYSDGTVSVRALLDHVEAETDLDVIAITDHERIDGALRAREMHAAGRYSFELVVGEEITTRRGHVLALFITERIPALRPLAETLERIHDQGGIAIAAHPMAPLTPSLGTRSLLAAHGTEDRRHRLDAIELMNPSAAGRARRAARERINANVLRLAAVGNSDAHVLEGIGSAWTWFPGSTAADYRSGRGRAHDAAGRAVLVEPPEPRGVPATAACQGQAPPAYSSANGRVAVTSVQSAPSTTAPSVQSGGPHRNPLKVGIVSPYGYPHPGGVNEHVRFTYEAMTRMGHDVWIITSKYGRERESEGNVIRLGTGWAAPANGSIGRVTLGLRFKRQAREVLEEHAFDILHFHEPFVPFLSPTVLDQSKTVNVATFHAFGGFSPSYWIGKRFAGHLAQRLHGRIAVSGAARHFISRYFPGEYEIIPNGVDLDRFIHAEPFEELRDGTLNILFVGRLEERKGLTHLLQAYHRLRKRKVDARLLVVGAGPKLREYKRFVGLRGIRDVEFLGRVNDDEKVRYFASADIYCAPNTGQESFGIVLLEAMAAGVPIVASDIHGFKRVVERNVQGLLVEPRNPRALAAALYALARDPDLRHDMGEAGRARAPEFTWDRVTERIVDFYYQTLESVLAGAR